MINCAATDAGRGGWRRGRRAARGWRRRRPRRSGRKPSQRPRSAEPRSPPASASCEPRPAPCRAIAGRASRPTPDLRPRGGSPVRPAARARRAARAPVQASGRVGEPGAELGRGPDHPSGPRASLGYQPRRAGRPATERHERRGAPEEASKRPWRHAPACATLGPAARGTLSSAPMAVGHAAADPGAWARRVLRPRGVGRGRPLRGQAGRRRGSASRAASPTGRARQERRGELAAAALRSVTGGAPPRDRPRRGPLARRLVPARQPPAREEACPGRSPAASRASERQRRVAAAGGRAYLWRCACPNARRSPSGGPDPVCRRGRPPWRGSNPPRGPAAGHAAATWGSGSRRTRLAIGTSGRRRRRHRPIRSPSVNTFQPATA